MSSKLSDIGFRICTTNDFLFRFFSQLLLLVFEVRCSTGELLRNNPMLRLIFEAVCTENSNPDVMMVKPAEDRV
jgi:hypothetical protein